VIDGGMSSAAVVADFNPLKENTLSEVEFEQ